MLETGEAPPPGARLSARLGARGPRLRGHGRARHGAGPADQAGAGVLRERALAARAPAIRATGTRSASR
ncbi:MAG: hypothetical protein MZV64_23810 [Ignavibacteriales bacterium]|nr:hypothetical protein [Ignavibacteriales bacterium]